MECAKENHSSTEHTLENLSSSSEICENFLLFNFCCLRYKIVVPYIKLKMNVLLKSIDLSTFQRASTVDPHLLGLGCVQIIKPIHLCIELHSNTLQQNAITRNDCHF